MYVLVRLDTTEVFVNIVSLANSIDILNSKFIAICDEPCQNGGVCVAPYQCNCTISWSGVLCTIQICDPICKNGGICTAPNTCVCDNTAWNGDRCQYRKLNFLFTSV